MQLRLNEVECGLRSRRTDSNGVEPRAPERRRTTGRPVSSKSESAVAASFAAVTLFLSLLTS